MIDNQDTIGDSGDFMADVRRANAERRMGMETAIEETAATGFVPGRVMPEPAMPAAPKFAGFTDEDAQLARRMAEDKKLAFMSTMMGAVDVNPDRAAEAIRFGNEVGVGPDIALNDFDSVQHAAKMKRIEQMNLMRRFPILARQLQDQTFANIAHDDLDNLAATEDVFSVVRGIPERIKGIPQGIAEGFKRGVATYELADLYERQRQSGGNLEVYQRAAIQSINDEMAQLGKESGFWESASNVVTLNLAQAPEVLETALATIAAGGLAGGAIGAAGGTMTTGGILAPVTAAGGAAAGMAIGLPAGLAAGAYESSRRLETALLYGEARRPTEEGGAGLDHEAANAAALAGGAISGLLEVAGVAVAGKAYSLALKNVIREGVKDAIKDRTRAQVFRTVGKTYLIGGAGEVGTEITQDIVNRASLEIAKAVRDQPTMFDNPGELRKFGGQLVDTALETAMAMTLLGIPGAAVQFHTGSRRAAEAERNAKFFDALAKNAAETKVAPRDGDKYRAYIGNLVNGTKFETMYVDAGEMRTVLQQQGLTLDDADSVFPGIKAQLEEIVGRTGDVTIPTAVYAERGARTDLGQAILPHVRPAPNAMSPLEAQQFAAERETLVREARSVLQEKERIDTAFVQEAQELEDVIRSEIRAARPDFDPAVARGWAKMSRDFYVVLAADLNTTPKALFEERKLQRMQIVGAKVGVAPLEQADQFDQAGQRNIDTPQFEAWNNRPEDQGGANKLNDASGKPIRLYHGTPRGGFLAFDPARVGMTSGYGRGGFSFTTNRQTAEAYAYGIDAENAQMSDMVAAVNRIFATVEYSPLLEQEGIWTSGDPTIYPEFDVDMMEDMEDLSNAINNAAAVVRRTGQEAAAMQLEDVVRTSKPPVPEVFEVYVYVPQNARELTATRETIGQVLAGIDVREQPGQAIIVNMPNDEKVVIVADPTSIKSVDNRGTWSRTTANIMEQAAMLEQAPVTPGFYSALEREVAAIDAKALTASGWGERFKGLISKGAIKADELEWSGLADYLKMQEGKVSKDAVLEFLHGNGVRVERVTLGQDVSRINASSPYAIPEVMRYAQEFQGNAPEAMLLAIENDGDVYRALARRFPQLVEREDWAQVVVDDVFGGGENVQQARYNRQPLVLLGGTNYREVLLTLPAAPTTAPIMRKQYQLYENGELVAVGPDMASAIRWSDANPDADIRVAEVFDEQATAAAARKRREFVSTHWDQPNVLVHLRMNDRVDADGKRVLFVEEVQSDWGQAGVKYGFANQRAADEAELAELLAQQEATPTEARRKQIARVQGRMTRGQYQISRAPYVETTDGWLNLGLKQVLLEAVRGNYDRVAFVNGAQSQERYNLSKEVESLSWTGYDSRGATKLVSVYPKRGNPVELPLDERGIVVSTGNQFDGKAIDEIVPKEIADQIMGSRSGELVGDKLKVGGEGMVEFYDKIVPIAMGKLLKKYGGGKFGQVAMATERRVTNDEIMAAERRGDFAEAERLTAIMERQELGRGEAQAGEAVIGDQPGFDITPELVKKLESGLPLFQAMPQRGEARGGFDPVTFILTLGKNADLTTFGHEAAHAFFEMYGQIAVQPNAPQRIRDSFDVLLRWGSIAGETPDERIATWNALPFEGRRKLHESFAYNWEIYLFEGKAPSVEMRDLFRKFSAWIRRVYKTIREELTVPQTISAIYRERYGEELLVLTPEVRQVMDRMLASEEQIAYREAVDDMKPMLTGRPEGMSDEAWAEYESNAAAARQDAVDELTRQSMKDMQWLSRAKAPILKKIQAKNEAARSAIRDEVTEQVKAMPVYRAMSYLRRGKLVDADGTETETGGTHRLDIDLVRNMYELRERVERRAEPSPEEADIPTMESVEDAMRPNWRKLGTGKYGMLGSDGLAPDMVAEMFGYANGDIMVRELIAAKPMAEMIADETDRVMTERYGIMTSPEAIEIQVQEALHNEARARMVATELKFLRKAVQPIRVLTEAARQAAQDIVDKKVIRELRPAEYTASEARAARQASTAAGRPQDPQTAGKAAYTRTYNEQVAAGVSEEEAVLAASTALGEATARAERALAQWQDKYGGRDPAEIAIRAKQQQLLQNQLAAEALKARDAIDKALAGFRKFFKADAKIAETREMPLVMAARAILAQRGIGRSDKPAAAYLEQLKEYNPSIHESVSEIVIAAGVGDYRDMTVEDFRTMAEAVEALWVKAKRDRLIQVGDEKVELDAAVDSLVGRLEEIGIPKELPGERQAIQFKDKSARFAMGVRAMSRRIESWSDAMDGKGDDKSFTRLLYRIVKDASTAFKVRRNEQIKKMYELVAKLEMPEGKIAAEEINYTFGAGNAGIGKAELLGAMLHIGNQSNYRKLLVGRGWGQIDENGNLDDSRWRAFVSRMIQQNMLTKKDFDFLQAVWDLNEEIKPLLQKAHYDLEGYYFKEIEADQVVTPFGTYRGGYVPAATDKFMVADAAQRAGMEELQADWRYSLPSTGMGMTKARVKGYNRPLALDLRLIVSHTDAALRFAMIQPAIADVLKIVKNRRFSDAMNRVDPEVIQRLILPWLNRAAKQSVSEAGLFRPVDQFWTAARNRTGMSIMFASVRNAAQQVVGLFPAALKVKPTYLKNALIQYMSSPLKTADMVAALSPFMQDLMRSQAFDMQDRMNEILLNPSKYQKAQEWIRQHAYFLQTAFQNPVNVITWLGAYNQFLAEQSAGMKPEKAEREAIAAGDSAVRLTQGSMQPEDIATIEAGTPFFRTFTQFSGYFNAMGNLNATEFVKTMRDMGWRGNKGKLLYIYMLGIMAPAIVSDAIVRSLGGGWDDDDEDGYLDIAMDWFFGSQVRYVTAFVPFGTTGYTLVTTAFDNKPYNDRMTTSPAVTAIEASTVGVGKAIVNAVDPDKEITGKNVRDVLTLVSLATGLPVSAAGRPIGYLVDVERGKIEPEGPVDLVRGLLTGTVTPESKR